MIPFYEYLKRLLYLHIFGGLLLGMIAGVFIFTKNYKNTLYQSILKIRKNLSTAQSIREEDELLKKKIEILRAYIPQGYRADGAEIFILEKLDRVKTLFPSSRLTVTEFQTEGDTLWLGFTLQGFIENWREFVSKIAILEGRSLPSLSIDKLTINVQADGSNVFQVSGRIRTVRFNP